MAQSNPQASYTDPQQPRRSSRLTKPAYRDPNFIYEDLQRQLDNFDDVDERYLLPSPSLFSDLQDHDRKETKRKVKRASSKQPTKVSDPAPTTISFSRARPSTGDSSGGATKREACFRASSFTSAPRPQFFFRWRTWRENKFICVCWSD